MGSVAAMESINRPLLRDDLSPEDLEIEEIFDVGCG